MDPGRRYQKCATAGCYSTASKTDGHCLKHDRALRHSSSVQKSSITGTFPVSSRLNDPNGTQKDSRPGDLLRNGQSQNGRSSFRENLQSVPSSTKQFWPMAKKSAMSPPELLAKYPMTARKTISALSSSKARAETDSPSPTAAFTNTTTSRSILQRNRPESYSPASPSIVIDLTTGNNDLPTNNIDLTMDDGDLTTENGQVHMASTSRPSLDLHLLAASEVTRNGLKSRASTTPNGHGQHRASGSPVKNAAQSPARASGLSQKSTRTHQMKKAEMNDLSNGYTNETVNGTGDGIETDKGMRNRAHNGTHIVANGQHAQSKSRERGMTTTTNSEPAVERNFRSMPYYRTNMRPPTRIKTAPTVRRSASAQDDAASHKRRRFSTPEETTSSSQISSSEDSSSEDHMDEDSVGTSLPSVRLSDRPPTTSQMRASSQILAPHADPLLTCEALQESNKHSGEEVLPTVEENYCDTRPVQRPELNDQGVSAPPSVEAGPSCEERRLQLCANFDPERFDAMIYGQLESTSPPRGVCIGAPTHSVAPAVTEERQSLCMRLDPRIHWTHNRSDEWYERQMEEIKKRGGRKANFGRAAKRMRQQRLAEEQRAAEETKEAAAAAKEGKSAPTHNPPVPWSHRRPMDFGDVPEQELPRFVQKNPAWLRATAWMRTSREENLQRNEEAAALQAAGKPWKHLFPPPRKRRR